VSEPRIVTRAQDARLHKHPFSSDPDPPQCPQLRILRIDGSLCLGSVKHVQETFDRIRSQSPQQKHLAIDAQGINFVDLKGGEVLVDEAHQRKANGGALYLIDVKQGLWNSQERCGCLDATGARNVFQAKTAAIHGIYKQAG